MQEKIRKIMKNVKKTQILTNKIRFGEKSAKKYPDKIGLC